MKKIIVVVFAFLLYQNTNGQNTNLGTNAGNAGTNNTSIGYYSGDLVTGSSNTFLGYYSGKINTSGAYNTFLGSSSGSKNQNGSDNTFVGNSSGFNISSGNMNTLIGARSGLNFTSGSSNVVIGVLSGSGNNGSNNVFLGTYAGGENFTGSGNIFIGHSAGYESGGSNKLYIQNSSDDVPLIYGDFSSRQLGINIRPNTTHALTVGGTIHATGIYVNGQSITDGGFEFWTKVGTNIWNNTGNVGIGVALSGTNNPNNYKLAVKGKIGAQEVQIENNSITWSDFVFNDDYKLLSLIDLEKYIKANHHLPEIPTQQEVRDNGILLSEMNAKLLQKVEELTLYMIEMKKELEILKSKVDENKD